MNEEIAEKAAKALRDAVDKESPFNEESMVESQTDRDVNQEEVDEEYADVEGQTPDPDNDTGSSGDPDVGTKQVTTGEDEISPIEIGHLEINEYYRVWIKDPEEAPPEIEVHPADQADVDPPTPESTHYYDAPFESEVAEVGIENAAKRLQEYDLDHDFPSERDITKTNATQADLWLYSAVQSGSPEKVTRTAVEMTKSPVTLFYASKRICEKPEWQSTLGYIKDELKRRGIEALDKIKKAEPVRATELRELNKRKIYVGDESKVPDEYEPQYGPQGGVYYELDSGDDEIEDGQDLAEEARNVLDDPELDIVDEIPVQAWRDMTGEINDREVLVKSLDPIQDHGTKTAKDRIRQRLRSDDFGLTDSEIDDLLADSDAPYSDEEHEEWQEEYEEMDIVESTPLWETDASTGASAEHMYVEELGNDTTAFVTRYGANEGNDPEARSRQMATYKASRALTAEGNVPPHVSTDTITPEEDHIDEYNKVAVKEFDGQEAWEAPKSYYAEIDRDDYVEQTAKQLLCGNNDLHGQNIMVNEDGDLGFHDLDHSAGRLDQNDPFNTGDVIEGSLKHIGKTASYIELVDSREEFLREVLQQAKEVANERGDKIEELIEETEDPHLREMLENIAYNIEIIDQAELVETGALGSVEVNL